MERKAKALLDSLSCWKANIYSARRQRISLELYRYHTNNYLVLSGRRRYFAEFHGRRYENRNPLEDPTIFGCYQSVIGKRESSKASTRCAVHADFINLDAPGVESFILHPTIDGSEKTSTRYRNITFLTCRFFHKGLSHDSFVGLGMLEIAQSSSTSNQQYPTEE